MKVQADESPTKTASTEQHQPEIARISEAFGHLIGKNLESLGFDFDMQAVVQGLKDSSIGKASPMSEVECIQAITTIQEAAFKEQMEVIGEKLKDLRERAARFLEQGDNKSYSKCNDAADKKRLDSRILKSV